MTNEKAITTTQKVIRIIKPLSLIVYLIIWALCDDLMMFVNGLIVSAFAIIVGHIVYLTVVRRYDLFEK